MKEYSFEEVIANIKVGETYKCTKDIYYINKISRNDAGFKFNNGKSIEGCATNNAQRFVKEYNPVSFMDVVKSDKRCKVEYYRLDDLIEEDSSFQWLKSYQNLDDIIYTLSKEFNTIAFKEFLINGKWYLEN